jgi:hypothetical protein
VHSLLNIGNVAACGHYSMLIGQVYNSVIGGVFAETWHVRKPRESGLDILGASCVDDLR